MLDLVGVARIDRYANQLMNYAKRYGSNVWHVIYQADVRARLEHLERLCRVAVEEHCAATARGLMHMFEPSVYMYICLVAG